MVAAADGALSVEAESGPLDDVAWHRTGNARPSQGPGDISRLQTRARPDTGQTTAELPCSLASSPLQSVANVRLWAAMRGDLTTLAGSTQ